MLPTTPFSWNAAAERVSGYSAREVVGRHLSVMLAPEARLEQAVRPGQVGCGAGAGLEVTCVGKDGCRMELIACPDPFSCDDDHGLL